MSIQKKMANRFNDLNEIDSVEVTMDGTTIYIKSIRYHAQSFKFEWDSTREYYVGYEINKKAQVSKRAKLSLRSVLEVNMFTTSYLNFYNLRAKRQS